MLGLVLLSCGEDTEPHPAYADPCTTPMGGVLSCPPEAINPPVVTIEDACRKLTSCGILAEKNMSGSSTACSSNDDCINGGHSPGAECLLNSDGEPVCYNHSLDYFWCVLAMTEPGSDPCNTDTLDLHFTTEHVQATIACIAATDCSTLGASFDEKRRREDGKYADNDKYVCKNGTRTIWTATICDAGLLDYSSHGS